MFIQRKRAVKASEEIAPVAAEATELLFEANDVADLVAEITGEPVEVAAEDETVTFTVGEDIFTIEAEGEEEILEATTRTLRGKRPVAASTARRPAPAKSAKPAATKTVRRPQGK